MKCDTGLGTCARRKELSEICGWAYQQTIENDVEDEHPQVPVGHVKTCPQPHQGDEQEQEEHQRHLCRQRMRQNAQMRKEGVILKQIFGFGLVTHLDTHSISLCVLH